ncbi:hypothetical protein L6164_016489 [Bauhinia variegata]|uniref:Uncharacterized protein n=1 Tax=Bauhinia variegata TaxID=167791 RepID=A0ACB9NNT8_BAUVA|nr:hypothetical protein L6164_016489 [Bauhinia variegata]
MAASSSSSAIFCSICWEYAFGDCPRTAATLQCKHTFHLDCIGSAFNFKGRMECPICRAIEPGCWRQKTDDHEDDYDVDDYYDDDYDYDYDYDNEQLVQEFEVEEDEERPVQETGLQLKEKIAASESSSSLQDSLCQGLGSQEDEEQYGGVVGLGLGLGPSPSQALGHPSPSNNGPSFTELQVQFAALKSQMDDMITYLMQQGHLPPDFFKPQTSSDRG